MSEDRDIAEELGRLTDATHALVSTIIAPVAAAEAVRVVRVTAETARLRRSTQWWRFVLSVTLAVMLSVALVDIHIHRSHVAPLENGVHSTSSLAPMWPGPATEGFAVGPLLLFAGLLVTLASVAGYLRASRRLAAQERREDEELHRTLAERLRPQ